MKYFLLLFTFIYSTLGVANELNMQDPNAVLHAVAQKTFARLAQEEARLEKQPEYIKVIINEELIPYFDYKYAAYKVMGVHLKKSTKTERNAFVVAFREYLVNAYGHILAEFNQQNIEILDNTNFNGKKIISIPVRIRDHNQKVTNITFKLRKNKKTAQWKVFDVIAEGISMLSTKQSELGNLIQK